MRCRRAAGRWRHRRTSRTASASPGCAIPSAPSWSWRLHSDMTGGVDPAATEPRSLRERVLEARVRAPARSNTRLQRFLDAADEDEQLKAWWHMQQVTAERLGMSDHSWVHIQIVLNIALRLFRLLVRRDVQPALVTEHGLTAGDAEVAIAAACLLHDVGMSIHRTDHEQFSLFLAADKLPELLADVYEEPERSIVVAEALHAVIAHRRRGDPHTMEAGVVRVADALDMTHGRSRVAFESARPNIHSLSAAAIDEGKIEAGGRPARPLGDPIKKPAGGISHREAPGPR